MDATPDRERAVGMPISADIVYVNKSPISPTRRGGGSRGLFVLTVLCLLGFGGFAFMAGRHTGRHAGKDMVVEPARTSTTRCTHISSSTAPVP